MLWFWYYVTYLPKKFTQKILLRVAGQALEEINSREITNWQPLGYTDLHKQFDKLTRQGITLHVDGFQAADPMRLIIELHT